MEFRPAGAHGIGDVMFSNCIACTIDVKLHNQSSLMFLISWSTHLDVKSRRIWSVLLPKKRNLRATPAFLKFKEGNKLKNILRERLEQKISSRDLCQVPCFLLQKYLISIHFHRMVYRSLPYLLRFWWRSCLLYPLHPVSAQKGSQRKQILRPLSAHIS